MKVFWVILASGRVSEKINSFENGAIGACIFYVVR